MWVDECLFNGLGVLTLSNQVHTPRVVIPFIHGCIEDGLSDLTDGQLLVLKVLGDVKAGEIRINHDPIVHDVQLV